jgi:hypothetical protein
MNFSSIIKYACSAALLIAVSVPANARTAYRAEGAQGDKARVVECGDEEYLVGFAGRTGSWMDQLQPICAKVLPDGSRDSLVFKKASGGKGGSPVEFSCPADSWVASTKMTMFKGQGRYVADIDFTCYRPRDGQYLPNTVRFGAGTGLAPLFIHSCPSGEIGTGVSLRYGVHVNAFGLICDTLFVPKGAPPVASAKPKPAPSTSTASSGPPAMTTLSFTGAWKVVTSEGRQYTLVLNPVLTGTLIPGQQIPFTGQFISTDGARQFNGSLQGASTYPSPMLNFNYGQPGLEAGGTGYFTINSDGQLIGTVVHMGKDQVAWVGGRNSTPPTPAAPKPKASSSSSSSETSAAPATSTLEEQTDRPGGDYSQTVSDDPVKCRSKCLKDKSCSAWTWVQEGVQGDKGQCYLKDSVPSARPGDCCTSGVITR